MTTSPIPSMIHPNTHLRIQIKYSLNLQNTYMNHKKFDHGRNELRSDRRLAFVPSLPRRVDVPPTNLVSNLWAIAPFYVKAQPSDRRVALFFARRPCFFPYGRLQVMSLRANVKMAISDRSNGFRRQNSSSFLRGVAAIDFFPTLTSPASGNPRLGVASFWKSKAKPFRTCDRVEFGCETA